jgi:hypothetical protein
VFEGLPSSPPNLPSSKAPLAGYQLKKVPNAAYGQYLFRQEHLARCLLFSTITCSAHSRRCSFSYSCHSRSTMSSTPRRPNFVRLPTTPTNPDRFIPSRDSAGSQTPRESFLLSRPPDRLSVNERLTRTNSTGPDPFSNALPTPPRTVRGPRHPMGPGIDAPSFHRSSLTSVAPRQASQGAVWQIGGAAALGDSVVGISNGRGGMTARGTNAPLYTSSFLSRPDQAAVLDVFERRLAAALDIDISSRTIQYTPANPTSTNSTSLPQSGRRNFSPTSSPARVWQDSEWKQPGNIAGLSLDISAVLPC